MSNTIVIYNTLNTNKLRTLIDSVFTISWGDGDPDTELAMPTIYDTELPKAVHTYSPPASSTPYVIEITVTSPWKVQKIKRTILMPLTGNTFPTDLGTLEFIVPYSATDTYTGDTVSQDYLMDYHELTCSTDNARISFMAIGKSRMDEFKVYGSSEEYSGTTTFYGENPELGLITGYTLDGLYYMDFQDG